MTDKLLAWITNRRALVLIIAILLTVATIATVAGVLWQRSRSKPKGETTPVLVDTSSSDSGTRGGGPGEVVVASSSGGGSVLEATGDLLRIALSAGQAEPQAVEHVPLAIGEPLSPEEIERILARLPALAIDPGDQVELKLPEDLLPPPRPGETIEQPFPPPPDAPPPQQVPTGPLEVLRYAPEGEIPLAPFVNVTFNQPMVPLATLSALSMEEVPVQIEPALPGTWKWLGTKTLRFEHDSTAIDRLPMATEYVVTVPAGTRSATGGVLEETVRWTFHTPPAKMIVHRPSGDSEPLDPIFLVVFDQRVDPDAVLDTVQVTADGQAVPVRLATEAELEADPETSRRAEHAQPGRWLAFVAQEPLPTDAGITVAIGPGTPSAEGPLLTTEVQHYSFHTYAPLRVERHRCSWYGDDCPPLAPWLIEFNNPIDVAAYDESMLHIEPELPGATVNILGDTITIRGMTVGRTTYRVEISEAIQDIFGQTLGTDTTLTFDIGPADPVLLDLKSRWSPWTQPQRDRSCPCLPATMTASRCAPTGLNRPTGPPLGTTCS